MKKKNKQAVLQKFSIFLNEFKAMANVDEKTKDYTPESWELINFLDLKWNEFCNLHGFFSLGKLFMVEVLTAKDCILFGKKKVKQGDIT